MIELPKLLWRSEEVYQYIIYYGGNKSSYDGVTVLKPNRQFDTRTLNWGKQISLPQRVRSPHFYMLTVI